MSATLLTACLVIGIADGDTLTARCDNQPPIKVRLAEIDAPEKNQPFGQHSKQSLSQMCFKTSADILVQTTDRYKRLVARVTCNGVDANAEQVRQGMAWVYDKYVIDQSLYAAQDEARQAHRGLWVDVSPMPPWEWRRSQRR
ncbi:MAG: thermonuclease family protein [Gallionella sp.]|nr:thermonuclease family protein [Gallionella sp.]